MSMNRLVLVLNASYEAITTCSAKRAIKLVMKGAAVVEEPSGFTIRTPQISVPVPSVIRLRVYRKVPRARRSVSRKGIILRDQSACQYCGHRLEPKSLTLDHVTPKSAGGQSTWENLVASCFKCNNRKGSRTPVQAGMPLIRQPRPVSIHAKHRMLAGDDNGTWDKYLYV